MDLSTLTQMRLAGIEPPIGLAEHIARQQSTEMTHILKAVKEAADAMDELRRENDGLRDELNRARAANASLLRVCQQMKSKLQSLGERQ